VGESKLGTIILWMVEGGEALIFDVTSPRKPLNGVEAG
jgi:hypothetical protein